MATTASVTTYQIQSRVFPTDASAAITITGMSGTTTVKVNLYFIKPEKPIPAPTTGPVPILLQTYLPDSYYAGWVDLLRNEKPLTLFVDGTRMYVQTGQEPAGAHELGL